MTFVMFEFRLQCLILSDVKTINVYYFVSTVTHKSLESVLKAVLLCLRATTGRWPEQEQGFKQMMRITCALCSSRAAAVQPRCDDPGVKKRMRTRGGRSGQALENKTN